MEDISVLTLGILFMLTVVSGTVDAMAGGGGLLNVPALLMIGFDPASALATNKFQGTFSSLSASVHFWRKGKIHLKDHILPCLIAFTASVIGAIVASYIEPELLRKIIPFLLIGIAVWMLCQPALGEVERKARLSNIAYALAIIPCLGFYDGFFGPGAGTFIAIANVFFLGLRLEQATIRAKLYNCAANMGATLSFLMAGHIVWVYALVMTVGTLIGGNIGARLILKHGTGLIKPVLVTMSLGMSGKLLWQQGIIQKLVGF
jgi:uncharacterized membrane protein YfcA